MGDYELPDECEFCDRVLDENEGLTPVFIGGRTKPKPVIARATAEKQREVIGCRTGSGLDGVETLNRPVDELSAIIQALEGCNAIDIDAKGAVKEVYTIGEREPRKFVSESAKGVDFDHDVDRSKVGVTITTQPRERCETPDLEVCEFCAESLRGEGDE